LGVLGCLDAVIGGTAAAADLDLARFHRFGNDPLELDPPLERTGRDAAMQIIALILVFGALAGDGELILLGNDLDIVRPEASDGQCDAIAILAVLTMSNGGKPSSSRWPASSMLNRRSKPTVERR
jgi:hypothetical protein